MNNHDFKAVPMPPQIAQRPRDKRGFPIPYGSIIYPDGTPDFTQMDMAKWADMLRFRRCGVCGLVMYGTVWFIGGPLCAVNRLFFDHPMHVDCAEYALQVCPFLALPATTYRKRKAAAQLIAVEGGTLSTDIMQGVSEEKPARFMLGKTKKYGVVQHNGEMFLQAQAWESLRWWEGGHELDQK